MALYPDYWDGALGFVDGGSQTREVYALKLDWVRFLKAAYAFPWAFDLRFRNRFE